MGIYILCPKCGEEFEACDHDEINSLDIMDNGAYFLVPRTAVKISDERIDNYLNNIKNAYISDGNLVIPYNETLKDPFDEFDVNHGTDISELNNNEDDDMLDEIELSILNDGHIPNNNLWRRWVMAQMLRHYKDANGDFCFDKYFITGKPYKYQWKTMYDEIKILNKLKGDELTSRERFFNMDVVKSAAEDYLRKIRLYVLRNCPVKTDKKTKRRYVELKYKGSYHKIERNTASTSFVEFMSDMKQAVLRIKNSTSYYELQTTLRQFINTVPINIPLTKSNAWKNAFKGAGAYYTMDNMIKFHKCNFTVGGTTLSTSQSQSYLEMKTNEYSTEYYKLYALMKQFIEDNNFSLMDILDAEVD